jgi:hypothetical protein
MLLTKSIISELVAGLNSGVESTEKAAALRLDKLLYPDYGNRGLMYDYNRRYGAYTGASSSSSRAGQLPGLCNFEDQATSRSRGEL